jgi:tRNA G18 (ribose-2'-O)-methylase SpoU
VSLLDFNPDKEKKYAFFFGNEVNGVSEEVMQNIDTCIEIPQFGTKHSFNIVISTGIVLWDFFSKFSR